MFSFLHLADLHLDAPCKGLQMLPSALQSRFQDLTFKAFFRAVSFAQKEKVDFVLVAGDVYNQEDRSIRAQLTFFNGLCQLAAQGIASFVVHGNHDPVSSFLEDLKWPDKVHVFGQRPDLAAVDKDGQTIARVAGVSHAKNKETRNLARLLPDRKEDVFHIALLHCNLGRNTGHLPYAPCSPADLLNLGYDYCALGHVHSRSIVQQEPWLVYPGNLQGLHANETGVRGGYLVKVDDQGQVALQFVPFSVLVWERVEIDLSDVQTLDQVQERVWQALVSCQDQAAGQDLVLRIRLTGRSPVYALLKAEEAQKSLLDSLREQTAGLEPVVWIQDVDYALAPPIDLEKRRLQGDFVARLLQESALLKEHPDPGLEQVLGELFAHPRLKRVVPQIGQEELVSLLKAAELRCLDLLEEDGDH